MTTDTPGLVYALIPQAMAEIGAIAKTQTNKFDRYQFRGIDDLYNALHGPLSRFGLFIVPHEVKTVTTRVVETQAGKTQLETTMVVRYRIYGPDGSFVEAESEGVGMDRGDKASNKAQTAAFKVLCFQAFMPPIEDGSDSERESPERAPPRERKASPLEMARRALYNDVKARRDTALTPDTGVSDGDFMVEVSRHMFAEEGAQTVEDVNKMGEAIEAGAYNLETGKNTEGR